ncbi:hypothetical protein PAXINDRAFT_12288 [Paxillus involutus ATCC 200175]|uniref:Protein kinase domain-containing protein n=1 Tax=Paxillus involutus ATCC 200175 TaxID=664439 RepID=A0A0C9U6G5_PAXIN|nr:hypothetical protein PAXINDRAFT_12288 [Paxillus involutus ATCC 200175]
MKRGFLNTDKAKRKLEDVDAGVGKSDVPPPKVKSPKKDKGKAKAAPEKPTTDADDHNGKIPGQRGALDLHSVPPYVKEMMNYSKNKNRFIFRRWPRDPNGKPILPSDIHGKEAGNGLDLWGATLYDFYHVRRIPSNIHGLTISTGSKLAKVMKAFGELQAAKDELAWAEKEEEPKEIPAWDPAEAIKCYETRVHIGCYDAYSARKDVVERAKKSGSIWVSGLDGVVKAHDDNLAQSPVSPKNESGETPPKPTEDPAPAPDDKPAFQQLPADTPVDSPFHSLHYPSPWPFIPFENPTPPSALQRSLPIHLLPKTLHVHDPWNLVTVPGYNSEYRDYQSKDEEPKNETFESWTSKDDLVHTYTLSLSSESQKAAEKASKAASAAENEALRTPQIIMILPQQTEGPTDEPAIHAVLPQRPRKLTEVPEAHLYISPAGKLGTGNHSVVYKAEWELPRELFCESTICNECVREKVDEEVKRLEECGEWEQRLQEAVGAYESTQNGGDVSQEAGPDAMNVDSEPSPSAAPPKKGIGFIRVTTEVEPLETIEMVSPDKHGEPPGEDATPHYTAKLRDPVINRVHHYEGPRVTVYPDVKWQNPSCPETICEHKKFSSKPAPRTARFLVAAKLSLPGDGHLAREAQNYLKFPAHFFQHWNGYNVVPPLHDPTPVGAVVPQFFGYYVPRTQSKTQYRSPILLIEHCGKPVNARKLSIDDKQECAALLFRFHLAGWLHESFAERNILIQKGHPTTYPLDRVVNPIHNFRLIDFGRSREYTNSTERMTEEAAGRELFSV